MQAVVQNPSSGGTFLSRRTVGVAGLLAGLGLAGEFVFFSLTGFTQTTLNDPVAAMPFLRDHGSVVRAAVLLGAFGVVGNVGDGLVALSFWTGIPAYVTLAGHNLAAAQGSWSTFSAVIGGCQGFGNLFLGLSALTAGWAIVTRRQLPVTIGAIGMVAGVAAITSVLGANGPSGFIGFATAIFMVIVFRIWAGIELFRGPQLGGGSPS
jgi:hypothetical protein